MPARSVASPISPPRASISLTRFPLARPPIAGLHDMRPMASRSIVTMATRAPPRAQTRAASAPAWPPPMTMTSYELTVAANNVPRGTSFPDAELREDLVEHLVARDRSGQQSEGVRGAVEIDEHHLLFVPQVERRERRLERGAALIHRPPLPLVDQAPFGRGEILAHQLVEIRQQRLDRLLMDPERTGGRRGEIALRVDEERAGKGRELVLFRQPDRCIDEVENDVGIARRFAR